MSVAVGLHYFRRVCTRKTRAVQGPTTVTADLWTRGPRTVPTCRLADLFCK